MAPPGSRVRPDEVERFLPMSTWPPIDVPCAEEVKALDARRAGRDWAWTGRRRVRLRCICAAWVAHAPSVSSVDGTERRHPAPQETVPFTERYVGGAQCALLRVRRASSHVGRRVARRACAISHMYTRARPNTLKCALCTATEQPARYMAEPCTDIGLRSAPPLGLVRPRGRDRTRPRRGPQRSANEHHSRESRPMARVLHPARTPPRTHGRAQHPSLPVSAGRSQRWCPSCGRSTC